MTNQRERKKKNISAEEMFYFRKWKNNIFRSHYEWLKHFSFANIRPIGSRKINGGN